MTRLLFMALVISIFAVLSNCMEPVDQNEKQLVRKLSLREPHFPITPQPSAREYIQRHPSADLTAEGYPKNALNPEVIQETSHRAHHTEIHRTMSVADGQIKIDILKDSDEDIKNLVTKRTLYLSTIGTGICSLLLGAGVSIAIKFGYCK